MKSGIAGSRNALLAAAVFALAIAFAGSTAQAQGKYPDKPIRFIVPFGAGGPGDILARTFGQRLSDRLGKNFIVENQGAASTIVGTQQAARSAPDGYTIVLFSTTHAINAASGRSMPYDTLKDFTPVAMLASSPFMLVVHPSMPDKLSALLTKAKSETINVSTAGIGSSVHLTAELFATTSGAKIKTIPYKGSGPSLIDLMAGQVQMSFTSLVSALPYVRNGQLRGLAITTAKRSAAAPDIPTLIESGIPVDSASWFLLAAPTGTPAEIVALLNKEINDLLDSAEVKKVLETDGADVIKMTPAQTGEFLQAEIKKWREVITNGKIVIE